MRTLTAHIVEGDPAPQLTITVLDAPGQGGACHEYLITIPAEGCQGNPCSLHTTHIAFQNGPIKEFGVNGVTETALLAILIDRLRFFQAGPYACSANGSALKSLVIALTWLQQRTRERLARGVEGVNQV